MTSQNSKHAESVRGFIAVKRYGRAEEIAGLRPTSQDRMRAISLAPALKLTAVQPRELGTVVRTHYEESVIERAKP